MARQRHSAQEHQLIFLKGIRGSWESLKEILKTIVEFGRFRWLPIEG